MLYREDLTRVGFEIATLAGIGTDRIGSCKSICHMIITTMAPNLFIGTKNQTFLVYA